jgi:hypothetical protein
VEAAVTDLGLAEEWYGKFNREAQPLPVLDLRESAMRLGPLGKYKGTLLATPPRPEPARRSRGPVPAGKEATAHR